MLNINLKFYLAQLDIHELVFLSVIYRTWTADSLKFRVSSRFGPFPILAVRLCFRFNLGNGCGYILHLTQYVLTRPPMSYTLTVGYDTSVVLIQDSSTMLELTLHLRNVKGSYVLIQSGMSCSEQQ